MPKKRNLNVSTFSTEDVIMEEATRLGRSVYVEDIWADQDQAEINPSPTDESKIETFI